MEWLEEDQREAVTIIPAHPGFEVGTAVVGRGRTFLGVRWSPVIAWQVGTTMVPRAHESADVSSFATPISLEGTPGGDWAIRFHGGRIVMPLYQEFENEAALIEFLRARVRATVDA
jgi:hypothetical protein